MNVLKVARTVGLSGVGILTILSGCAADGGSSEREQAASTSQQLTTQYADSISEAELQPTGIKASLWTLDHAKLLGTLTYSATTNKWHNENAAGFGDDLAAEKSPPMDLKGANDAARSLWYYSPQGPGWNNGEEMPYCYIACGQTSGSITRCGPPAGRLCPSKGTCVTNCVTNCAFTCGI
jgi:hypothetical protein